jgi:hypothetical protein
MVQDIVTRATEKTSLNIDFWLRPITIVSADQFLATSQIIRPVSPKCRYLNQSRPSLYNFGSSDRITRV